MQQRPTSALALDESRGKKSRVRTCGLWTSLLPQRDEDRFRSCVIAQPVMRTHDVACGQYRCKTHRSVLIGAQGRWNDKCRLRRVFRQISLFSANRSYKFLCVDPQIKLLIRVSFQLSLKKRSNIQNQHQLKTQLKLFIKKTSVLSDKNNQKKPLKLFTIYKIIFKQILLFLFI